MTRIPSMQSITKMTNEIDWTVAASVVLDDQDQEWIRWEVNLSEPYYFDDENVGENDYPWSCLDSHYAGNKHKFTSSFKGMCVNSSMAWSLIDHLGMYDDELENFDINPGHADNHRGFCFSMLYLMSNQL